MGNNEFILIPDTPELREMAEKIKLGLELCGWEAYEKALVEDLNLTLVKEEGGRRFYEGLEGQLKISIGTLTVEVGGEGDNEAEE